MSGGSYNYLCRKAADGLLAEAPGMTDLEEMAARLEGLEWAADVAAEVRQVLATAAAQDETLRRLEPVFRAVEWWDSADWSEGQVHEAIATYRGT